MTFGEQVGQLLRTLRRGLSRHVAERTDRPVIQLRALWVVSTGEVETQAQLAQRLLIDPPAASRLVSRLKEEGLMRQRAGSDRRSVKLEVTRAAAPEVKVMKEAVRWLDAEVGKNLRPAEKKQAMALMRKVHLGFLRDGRA